MKQSDARDVLNSLLVALQKFRSINAEANIAEELAVALPWVQDKKRLMNVIIKMLDGDFTPMNYYNILYICHELERTLAVVYALMTEKDLPKPDMSILTSTWEHEGPTHE